LSDKRTAADHFRMILETVLGQVFAATGYTLEESPVKQAGGLFRYRKALAGGLYAFIEFQMLYLPSSEWSAAVKSRFRVTLIRSDQPDAQLPSAHPQAARKTLSALIVNDFGVAILPNADYWWMFDNTESLGKALAEAGHLIIAYGVQWLAGELTPPSG
jgi:hypothetical protein